MTEGHSRGTGTYWGALDGLRALAVGLVFLTHLPMRHWRGGFVGVDVFFCLSGLLITTLLVVEAERHGRISIRRFYARRLARLYPALLLGLVVAAVVVAISSTYHLPGFLRDSVAAVTYTTNFRTVVAHPVTPIGQFWSLAVEEQFYLVWAPLLYLVHRRLGLGVRTLQVAVGLLVAYVVAKAAVLWLLPPKASNYAYYLLPGHVDELLLGAVLALALHVTGFRVRSAVLPAAALAALVVMAWRVPDRPTQTVASAAWIGAAALGAVVMAHVTTTESLVTRLLSWSPLRWVGARSYGIYLYHVAVLRALTEHYGYRPLRVGALGLVITLVLAALSWRYVEEPVLRWRDRNRAMAETPVAT